MVRGRQQSLRFVLSDDLRDLRRELAHVSRGCGTTIDANARLARRCHLAHDGRLLARIDGKAVGIQAPQERVVGFECERDDRSFRVTSDGSLIRSSAQRKAERTQKHRFAGAGLARENCRAVGKVDLGTRDETVVLDLQPLQQLIPVVL